MMAQEAKNVSSIFELVQGHKADTGIMLRLNGVTIEKRGSWEYVVNDGDRGVHCFGGNGVDLGGLPKDGTRKYDVTGTWHGNYFLAYQIDAIN